MPLVDPGSHQPSCYLLEFSVMPGGARMGDIHAYDDIDAVRASFDRRYEPGDPVSNELLSSLIVWYGAVLHLWVVQHGVVTQGIDLHPYLRTGVPRYDRTLARSIPLCGDDLHDYICEIYESPVAALPLLDRLFELRDRVDGGDEQAAADLESLTEAIHDREVLTSFRDERLTGLRLDWAAVAEAAPALREPLLGPGEELTLRWPPEAVELPSESHLKLRGRLHAGVNDTEEGHDEYPT